LARGQTVADKYHQPASWGKNKRRGRETCGENALTEATEKKGMESAKVLSNEKKQEVVPE